MTFVLPIPGKWSKKRIGKLCFFRIYATGRKWTFWVFIEWDHSSSFDISERPDFKDNWDIGAYEFIPAPKGE